MSATISWIAGLTFYAFSLLNLILVHPVPGVFYFLLSLIYFPPINIIFKERWGFSIPRSVKIIVGLFVFWASLAVGDLAEIFGL